MKQRLNGDELIINKICCVFRSQPEKGPNWFLYLAATSHRKETFHGKATSQRKATVDYEKKFGV